MKGSDRNQPCKCGSGIKAKKCQQCVVKVTPQKSERLRDDRSDGGMPAALLISAMLGRRISFY